METVPAAIFVDSLHIGLSDSFLENPNKTGTGNGEAKLYLGHEMSQEFKTFFGDRGFSLNCKIQKTSLVRFMKEVRPYYFNPPFRYRASDSLKSLWHQRMKEVNEIPDDVIEFKMTDQVQIDPPRCYAKSTDRGFTLLRKLPLSHLAKLVMVKYEQNQSIYYDLKLVLDVPKQTAGNSGSSFEELMWRLYSGDQLEIGKEVERIRKERIGQEKFRARVIEDCKCTCAFTGVTEKSLLIAGHIKPWADSDEFEKVDSQNGLAFTPTYDKLFNDGYISFSGEGSLMISPLLSRRTRSRLSLVENQLISIPIIGDANAGRRRFLEHHREFVYRK